jgi:hypothetical protein
MSQLIDRVSIAPTTGQVPGWAVALDDAPLLHLSEQHVAVNDLRASRQFHWGIALLRRSWTEAPGLRAADDAVQVLAADGAPVVTLRWHPDRPAHVGVEVDDFGARMLDLEVRYRQLPSRELPGIASSAHLGR